MAFIIRRTITSFRISNHQQWVSPHCYIESVGDRALGPDLQLEARHGATAIGEGDNEPETKKTSPGRS